MEETAADTSGSPTGLSPTSPPANPSPNAPALDQERGLSTILIREMSAIFAGLVILTVLSVAGVIVFLKKFKQL
jgi:hypothetical protein